MNESTKSIRRLLWFSIFCLLVVAATPRDVAAQYTNPYTSRTWNNPMSSYLDTVILHRMQRTMLERQIAARYGVRKRESAPVGRVVPSSPKPATWSFPIEATDFRPTGTRLLPETLAASTPGATAEQKDVLKNIYHQSLEAFEKEARKNNVAYALTFLLGASLQIVTEKEIPDEDAEQLARELNGALAAIPEFQKLSSKEKQAIYEVSVITGGFMMTLHQLGVTENDDGLKQQAKELAQSIVSSFM